MGRTARAIGGASILLAPLAYGISDQLRMVADPPTNAGLVGEYGVPEAVATLASIEANRGTFLAASLLAYAAMLLTVPALVAIWRLSVDRSARWAWTGAVLAAMFALGQAVHLVGHFATSLAAAGSDDHTAAAELMLTVENEPLVLALFVPLYLLGLLAAIPQAIGLRRARVLPLWACLSIIGGTILFLVVGSMPWSSAAWMALMVAGLTPAAATMLRGTTPARSPLDLGSAGVDSPSRASTVALSGRDGSAG